MKPPDLRESPEPNEEIKNAALSGTLVLFVGAGISNLLEYPLWFQLALSVFDDLRKKGCLNYSDIEQLKKLNNPKIQLSIAKQISEENNITFDITKYFKNTNSQSKVYDYINIIGCPCITTNYDEQLKPIIFPDSTSTTPPSPKRIFRKKELLSGLLNEPNVIIHLHGSVSERETMVITTEDYLEHYQTIEVKEFLQELFRKKTVLFLGYGLEEVEILEYIFRKGKVKKSDEKKRFSLQGFFQSEKPLYEKLYNYYSNSFGVYLIGFLRDFKNYNQIEDIIKSWSEQIKVNPTPLYDDLVSINEVLNGK